MTKHEPPNGHHNVVRAGRLRFGVALIIVWWVPLWALGPWIADSLSGISKPPSDAAVTVAIIVGQTIIGLIGFWAAGVEIKSIIRHDTKRQAFKAAWSVLVHGKLPDQHSEQVIPDEHLP